MAPNLPLIPSTLKAAQLKLLAFKCGISTSGTKPILTSRLHDALSTSLRPSGPVRILSIDMGIRNLAYCVLDVPAAKTKRPTIHAWQRIAVSTAPTRMKALEGEDEGPVIKEAFDPATLSRAAYTLLRTKLLPEKPTHVLIERQRFRSMGSKHILEWTIRVNMFESILHAVLCTLKAEGAWKGEVEAITPGKVGPFWIGEDDGEGKDRKSKNMKVINKGRKMDLVRGWLERNEMVSLGNESVEDVARQYKEKWERKPGGRKGPRKEVKEETMGKLDDLADCLLQGLAWVQWEENKRLARKLGVEALLDP